VKALVLAAALALTLPAAAFAAAPPGLAEVVQQGDRALALKLIAGKADVNRPSAEDGSTAVLWAVHNGDVELVRALIAAGADVKHVNAFDDTAMREAASVGNVEILKALLDGGADVDSPTPLGQTALMAIARTANVEAATLLIERGAKVNAFETYDQQTALMWASDQAQPEMVRLLIAHGADPNARSRVHQNDIRVTAEPRVKYDPTGGMTPLLFAARSGCLECAKALVAGGAKVNGHDPDGIAPLFLSIYNTHFDMAAWLIKAGADVNKWDFWGRTPLWAAVDYNTLPHGGRPDRPAPDDTTPLDLIKQLLAAGANPNAQLKFFFGYRDNGADRGADMMMTTGATPLLRASRAADIEAMKLLLAAGARVDLPVARAWRDAVGGITPLMAAAGLKNSSPDTRGKLKTEPEVLDAVKLLIAAHADVNAKDERGDTALHGAVYRGYNEVVRALIAAGADPYLANAAGKSAFDIAHERPINGRGQIVDIKADTAELISQLKPLKVAQSNGTKAKAEGKGSR
jgi:ankyrin repeat protein